MTNTTNQPLPVRRQSIVAAAVLQFVGGAAGVLVSGVYLWDQIYLYRISKRMVEIWGPGSAYHFNISVYLLFIACPLILGLLGVASSFGLFCLREWARKTTIFLSTVPVLGCALLVLLGLMFLREPGQGALLVVGPGVYLWAFECLLIVLIPISIWWLIVFMSASTRSQFR